VGVKLGPLCLGKAEIKGVGKRCWREHLCLRRKK